MNAARIRTVLLPARNRKDLEDIPVSVRDELKFVWLERAEEATPQAFGNSESRALEATGT